MAAPERNFPFKLKPAVAGEKVADAEDIEGLAATSVIDQDSVYEPTKAILTAGPNVSINADDINKTLTVGSTGGGGGGGGLTNAEKDGLPILTLDDDDFITGVKKTEGALIEGQ